MSRRILDGLIVLWGIMACLLMAGGRELLAAPGACDKECRIVSTAGAIQGGKTVCRQFKFQDCEPCTNGCISDLPKLGGTCKPSMDTQKEATDFICAISCNNPAVVVYYQAATNVTDFTYVDKVKINECKLDMPGNGGL